MPKQLRTSSRSVPNPQLNKGGARASGRVLIFVGVCLVCLIVVGVAAINANRRINAGPTQPSADAPASPDVLASVASRPHLVFLHSPSGDQYRQVAIVPLDAPDGPRYLTPL